jgi:glycosyltransferase involved in cell wall biosynthesis
MAAAENQSAATGGAPRAGVRLAVLMSQYPAVSHTFFLAEVLGLRRLGFAIETASVNAPDRPTAELPAAEAAEAATTLYLKVRFARTALRVAAIAVRHPWVALRGLAAAVGLAGSEITRMPINLAYLAEALLVGDWMRRRGLGHLHVHFGGAVADVGCLTNRAWGIPWSLTLHGPDEFFDLRTYRLQEKLATASFVRCISEFGRWNAMRAMLPERWERISLCHLGIDPRNFPEPERRTLREDEPVHVVCVGRLIRDKGQRVLLEAMRRLSERGVRLRLTLVGRGADEAALKALVGRHGLPVKFAGAQAHPATLELLRTADIFALPSFAEGIPVALMEAMAEGLPCISTTACGIPELIRSGQDGLLVGPGDAEGLTEALGALAADAELRRRLGEAGRKRVLEEFNLEINLPRLGAILDEALELEAAR